MNIVDRVLDRSLALDVQIVPATLQPEAEDLTPIAAMNHQSRQDGRVLNSPAAMNIRRKRLFEAFEKSITVEW